MGKGVKGKMPNVYSHLNGDDAGQEKIEDAQTYQQQVQ
jgi:hypothetical protein